MSTRSTATQLVLAASADPGSPSLMPPPHAVTVTRGATLGLRYWRWLSRRDRLRLQHAAVEATATGRTTPLRVIQQTP